MKINAIRLIAEKEHAQVFIQVGKREYLLLDEWGESVDHWVNMDHINSKTIKNFPNNPID